MCRYAEAEKTNGRWAMAGVAGIMGQELLGVTPKWFEAGAKPYPIDPLPLLALEFIFLGFLETKRYQGYKNTGSVRLLPSFVLLYPFCTHRENVCRADFRSPSLRQHCDGLHGRLTKLLV